MIVNASELADLMGVHRNTVAKWARNGCPFIQKSDKKRGLEWQFESSDVIRWTQDQAIKNAVGNVEDVQEDELRRRKLAAETAISEIEAAKAKGLVVLVEDVIRIISDDYVKIKQRLRTIPARVAPSIVGEPDETVIKSEIETEIDESLNELSTRFINWDEESSEGDQQE